MGNLRKWLKAPAVELNRKQANDTFARAFTNKDLVEHCVYWAVMGGIVAIVATLLLTIPNVNETRYDAMCSALEPDGADYIEHTEDRCTYTANGTIFNRYIVFDSSIDKYILAQYT